MGFSVLVFDYLLWTQVRWGGSWQSGPIVMLYKTASMR